MTQTIREKLDEILHLTEELKKMMSEPAIIDFDKKYPESFISEKEAEVLSDQDLENNENN